MFRFQEYVSRFIVCSILSVCSLWVLEANASAPIFPNPFLEKLQTMLDGTVQASVSAPVEEQVVYVPTKEPVHDFIANNSNNKNSEYESYIRIHDNHIEGSVRFFGEDRIAHEYFITFPNGDVAKESVLRDYICNGGHICPGVTVSFRFPVYQTGTYRVEFLNTHGYPIINEPLAYQAESEREAREYNDIASAEDMIAHMNAERQKLGRAPLQVRADLTFLAYAKSLHMMHYDYVGHESPDKKRIVDFLPVYMERPVEIGENVA